MSNDNGDKLNEADDRLRVIEARIKELEPLKDNDPSGMEGGKIRKELSELYNEKLKLTAELEAVPKDFKIAEIWIKEGQLVLDASPEFWMDKLRALGVLEMCKDIVKNFKKDTPKVLTPQQHGMMNFARKIMGKK